MQIPALPTLAKVNHAPEARPASGRSKISASELGDSARPRWVIGIWSAELKF